MIGILEYLPTHSIVDFMERCPFYIFVRFISCNRQLHALGKPMMERKLSEILTRTAFHTCGCTQMGIHYKLPNGNLHGLETFYTLPDKRILSFTNWRNGKRHGVHKEYYYSAKTNKRKLRCFEIINADKETEFSYVISWSRTNGYSYAVKAFMVQIGRKMTKFEYITTRPRSGRKRRTFLYQVEYFLPNGNHVVRRLLNEENLLNPLARVNLDPGDRAMMIENRYMELSIVITDVTELNVRELYQQKLNEVSIARKIYVDEEKMIFVGYRHFECDDTMWEETEGEPDDNYDPNNWWNLEWETFEGSNWFVIFVQKSQLFCVRYRKPLETSKSPLFFQTEPYIPSHIIWT